MGVLAVDACIGVGDANGPDEDIVEAQSGRESGQVAGQLLPGLDRLNQSKDWIRSEANRAQAETSLQIYGKAFNSVAQRTSCDGSETG